MDEINRKRLEWVANAEIGAMDWGGDLFVTDGNPGAGWGKAMSAAAQAALDEIAELDRTKGLLSQLMEEWTWRPIAEAPIPPPDGLPIYWSYACLIQTVGGRVAAGFVRYVDRTTRGRSPRVLRWYEGVPQSYTVVPDPKYFMPLPAKRED